MRARDIMTRPVVAVREDSSAGDASALLTKHQFAALPVIDEDGRVVGIFSETNALRAPAPDAAVSTVMTTPVEVASPNSDVEGMSAVMLAGHLRSMPVVEAGLLIGIVSRSDLLRAQSEDAEIASNVRALLDQLVGSRRAWQIDVRNGRVEITGGFADTAEERVVGELARTVDGVRHVDVIAGRLTV